MKCVFKTTDSDLPRKYPCNNGDNTFENITTLLREYSIDESSSHFYFIVDIFIDLSVESNFRYKILFKLINSYLKIQKKED
jgi:hypothetical protein